MINFGFKENITGKNISTKTLKIGLLALVLMFVVIPLLASTYEIPHPFGLILVAGTLGILLWFVWRRFIKKI